MRGHKSTYITLVQYTRTSYTHRHTNTHTKIIHIQWKIWSKLSLRKSGSDFFNFFLIRTMLSFAREIYHQIFRLSTTNKTKLLIHKSSPIANTLATNGNTNLYTSIEDTIYSLPYIHPLHSEILRHTCIPSSQWHVHEWLNSKFLFSKNPKIIKSHTILTRTHSTFPRPPKRAYSKSIRIANFSFSFSTTWIQLNCFVPIV